MTVALTPADNSQKPERRPLYEGSTQFKNWRFSVDQLRETRRQLNTSAIAVIRNALEVNLPGSSSEVSFLTPGEECLLVKHYIGKVSQLCGHLHFPEEVEATAVSYLKRFYLKNTAMDWHPKNVMLTAVFLATKTTNNPMDLEAYTASIPKTTLADVLDLEFLVAQSLNFEFTVWHAHRALWGIYLDIQSMPNVLMEMVHGAYGTALQHVRAARLTDAELIYTPSQVALAAFALASPGFATVWAHTKGVDSARSIIDDIKAMILYEGREPDVERVRDVDLRLRSCKNPEKIPGTKAYLVKKAEEEARARAKRERKAENVKRSMEAGDPFGDELAGDEVDAGLEDDDYDD